MIRRILSSFLVLCMLCTIFPSMAFAAEDNDAVDTIVCAGLEGCTGEEHDSNCPLYEEINTDKPESSHEGNGSFGETGASNIPVTAPMPAPPVVMQSGSEYEVSDAAGLTKALSEIAKSEAEDATIVLTNDITDLQDGFAGVQGKHITLKSSGDEAYTIPMSATGLIGDVTLANVKISRESYVTLYANGYTFETTEEFDGKIQNLYGGGSKDVDIDGDTNIILRGGNVTFLHGGGQDSAVNGDVSILIDGPEAHVGTLYGGGHAQETGSGTVSGDVTVTMRQGSNGYFFGGGHNTYSTTDNENDREPASVTGTVTVNFGYEGAPEKSVWPGTAMYSYAGSYHSTVGNIVLNITDGFTSENQAGDRNVFGCGYNDTVLGTVEIHISGTPDIGHSFIYGGGSTGDELDYNWPVRILNQEKKERALYVTYDVPSELGKTATGHGISVGSDDSLPMIVDGNILVELKSGNMDFLVLDNENQGNLTVNGNSEILIHEGRVAQVEGNNQEYDSEGTDHTTTVKLSGKSEIGYFYRFDDVTLNSSSEVLVDATQFGQFGGKTQKPFFSVDDLVVEKDAVLTTQNNGQARILSSVALMGTWEQKYCSGTALADDDDRSSADLRLGGSMTVDGGTLISHGTTHVYNDLEANGGTLVFMKPAIIGMSAINADRVFSVDGTKIYLPVIGTKESFYPADKQVIRLAVGEKATGTADVYLFEGDDYSTPATITDEHVSQNYINGQREKSDAIFTLKNSEAYYFKRVDDTKEVDSTAYDMWQIAKDDRPVIILTPQDMTAYTGGDSLSGDSFPTARYKIEAESGVNLSEVKFTVNGEEKTLPADTKSGDIVVLPWLDDTFTLNKSASMGLRTFSDSVEAAHDAVAGEYEIGADIDRVSAVHSDEDLKIIVEPGKLTVRYVSAPDQVIAGTVDIAQPVVTDKSQVNTDDGIGIAVIPDGTFYYTNGKAELGVLGDDDSEHPQIALLFDDLLPGEAGEDTKQLLIDRAVKAGHSLTDSNSQFKYLDLINENDGNAWVSTSDGTTITIYWPCPDGVNISDYNFEVLHFKGLHREYRGDLENQINDCEVEEISATAEGNNLVFTLVGDKDSGSFSPFALTWAKKGSGGGGGGGGTTYYTLHYESNGGTEYKDERYKKNTVVELDKVPARESYIFTGWYADEELTERITEIKMTSDKTVYAGWEPTGVPDWLNGKDHFAYVVGYTDGTVRPLDNISRAEVATIFFRLLNEDIREENLTASNTFADVNEGMWCNTAISTMAKLGVVKGRSPEHFDPDAPITRAEFAAICARFDTSKRDGDSNFTDIAGHWAEAEIERAATLGWIMGYTDGTFRPENYITRAEAMAMINRVLNRLPESEDDLLDGMNVWPDNQLGAWYYLAVQEATNSHDFNRKGDVHEHWTKLTADPDWTKYQ